MEKNNVDILTYTLANLPQVLIDGVVLGFVYAAIALGYTMVYGVLEFINFAHSELFTEDFLMPIAAVGAGWHLMLANGHGKAAARGKRAARRGFDHVWR